MNRDQDMLHLSTIAIDFDTVSRLLTEFGIEAVSAERLDSYEDANFLVVAADDDRFVLKLTARPDASELIEAEAALLDHVASRSTELPTPRMKRSISGSSFVSLSEGDHKFLARVHTFLPGSLLLHFRPRSRALRVDLGRRLGQLNKVLADFQHPAYRRHIEWDLAKTHRVRDSVGDISTVEGRKHVAELLDFFDAHVLPRLNSLPKSVIHADANDHNLLVSTTPEGTPFISGIVDFGDTVETITVAELAIACTYAMLSETDPVAAAADVVHGYHAERAVSHEELEVLYPLILGRLAMSAVFSARWRVRHGDSTYHSISESHVWSAIEALRDVRPEFAHYVFRDACGLPAVPKAARVMAALNGIDDFAPVVEGMKSDKTIVFDLGVASAEAAGPDDNLDPTDWTGALFGRMAEGQASVGIGRYDEPRVCYAADQFTMRSGEKRTIHLGIDIFAPPGSGVHAPLDGVVHSVRDNDLPLDYGPTAILEHTLGRPASENSANGSEARSGDAVSFYTLYGHLSRESLEGLEIGKVMSRGQEIGRIGSIEENGGWPPHVHFQIIADMLGQEGNFPGVAPPSKRSVWTSLCPDPNTILRIPQSRFPDSPMGQSDIERSRSRFLGRNLSVSYREPLHIVRGHAQYLYDSDGRQYLDCVNNVAHVGHCHPRVVEAAAAQMRVLNTNTRYLHENIVRYAERLAATMPAPLQVCYFVNSGSEANDLALRLAKAHTGADEIMVLGSAYHGHLTSLIDVSPYKSEGAGGHGLPDHVHRLRAPDVFRGDRRDSSSPATDYAADAVDVLRRLQSKGRALCAFIAESALGCAGQIILPEGYLEQVYRHVRSVGGVCIADEVQVGFGRIGTHFWGFESQGVVPDIVTLGKPIGNGHPIGAVVTTAEIATSFDNGMEYFNTFGGNPVSAAVGLAVLDVIRDEGLQQHAHDVGTRLLVDLDELRMSHPIIGDVRGAGLFIGIELVRGAEMRPAAREADYLINRMKDQGILLSTDGPDHNVIKFKPPMPFTAKDGARLVEALDMTLKDDFLK